MTQESYFKLEASREYGPRQGDSAPRNDDSFLDQLLHQKSRIFASKLEVLAVAMVVRLRLFRENVSRIDADKEGTEAMLAKVDRQALYHLRDHRDKTVFYQTLFRLEEERRSQAVECWRDVVLVLRDFLDVWEAHQQSQARAVFLDHVGG